MADSRGSWQIRKGPFEAAVFIVIALIMANGLRQMVPPIKRRPVPVFTSLVYSYNLPGHKFVLRPWTSAYLTRSAMKQAAKMEAIGDVLGLAELKRSGQAVRLQPSTEVLCVEAHYSAVRIRVLSGPRVGQLWVASDAIPRTADVLCFSHLSHRHSWR
jgi:hypothetical protein